MTEEPLTAPVETASDSASDATAAAEVTGGRALSTGDARVDQAVGRLEDLEGRELDEHADSYDRIHGDLAEVLDDDEQTSDHQRHDEPTAPTGR